MESINMASVLQKAGDADSRVSTRPQVLFHHSLHFHIYYIISFVPQMSFPLCYYYKWWEMGWVGVGVFDLY